MRTHTFLLKCGFIEYSLHIIFRHNAPKRNTRNVAYMPMSSTQNMFPPPPPRVERPAVVQMSKTPFP